MIRVLGNSSERVPIKDLNDCIYYKQLKEYSDQEFESSNDLRKAINSGKIVKLEQTVSSRGSADSQGTLQTGSNSALNVNDLKSVLREMFPKGNGGMSGDDVRGAIRDMAPLIVDMVRQEVSKIQVQGPGPDQKKQSDFVGPEYIPTVSTEGMVSNIEAKEQTVSGNDANEALEALRKLQGIK
jgi:hypothetical protein